MFIRKLIPSFVDSHTLLADINFRVPTCSLRNLTSFIGPFSATDYHGNSPVPPIMHLANEDPSLDF